MSFFGLSSLSPPSEEGGTDRMVHIQTLVGGPKSKTAMNPRIPLLESFWKSLQGGFTLANLHTIMESSYNDPRQREIVVAPQNVHIKVLACPGSGKTRVLVQRACHLIEHFGVKPSAIRVVTFSRHAAADVGSRLQGVVKAQTIHSLCLEIAEAFEPILHNSLRYVPAACAWSTDSAEDLDVSYLPDEKESVFQNAEAEVFFCDEHIYRLLRAFEAAGDEVDIAAPIRDLIPDYLLVDESQDLDATQFRVIELLVKRFRTRIFMVGDKCQGIYKFRKSDSDLMDRVDTLGTYPSITFYLNNNYRSTQTIVDFCNDMRPDRSMPPMATIRDFPSWLPRLCVFEERSEEIRFVADLVQSYVTDMGRVLGDIAILSRTQREAYALAHKFTEMGLPTKICTGDAVESSHKHREGDPLTISSFHGAKGLEFGVVIVTGCTDSFNKFLTPDELQQEAQLYYVACSRAKDILVITSGSRCISRMIFPVKSSRFKVDMGDPKSASPIFGIFGDVNALYGSVIERVIYRQILSACLRESGSSDEVKMTDHFANMCFLWTKAFEDDWRLREPTEQDVRNLIRNKAAEFQLPESHVAVHYENRSLPSFARPSKDDAHKRTARFAAAVERIGKSYKRYVNFDHDTESTHALKTIADVAVCAHLAYPPAKTHYVFSELHLGDLVKDKNLGLFSCTRRLVNGIMASHFETRRAIGTLRHFAAGDVVTPELMLGTFRVGLDIDLSTKSLRGVADMVIGDTVYDIKCSSEKGGIQAAWVLQLMCYLSLARLNGLKVDNIAIYCPLQGFVWKAPMHMWQRHEELIRRVNEEISGSSFR
ncbi:DNA helicase II / ATP-dependent DNA helicase PcrA [Klebsormidium nitens]|uniref:DNA 3'-5' helicase n=1 Tax=Klebsormidium nitens TaxID=105231 RepID=A0A1Y1IMY4_KLENI|nr:DNA helicase II / ATP-dependent DNA helicase PcrA [Klebsormidium nitens]|eukprot:GAQ92013.1 DNA helicase II / ATP-dependent DNA helicase PcrA [Klebsormidium nitens]